MAALFPHHPGLLRDPAGAGFLTIRAGCGTGIVYGQGLDSLQAGTSQPGMFAFRVFAKSRRAIAHLPVGSRRGYKLARLFSRRFGPRRIGFASSRQRGLLTKNA